MNTFVMGPFIRARNAAREAYEGADEALRQATREYNVAKEVFDREDDKSPLASQTSPPRHLRELARTNGAKKRAVAELKRSREAYGEALCNLGDTFYLQQHTDAAERAWAHLNDLCNLETPQPALARPEPAKTWLVARREGQANAPAAQALTLMHLARQERHPEPMLQEAWSLAEATRPAVGARLISVHLALRNVSAARTAFEDMPDTNMAAFLRGRILMAEEKFADAAAAYQRIAPSWHKTHSIPYFLGYALVFAGQHAAAIPYLEEAVSTFGHSTQLRFSLARNYRLTGRHEAAFTAYAYFMRPGLKFDMSVIQSQLKVTVEELAQQTPRRHGARIGEQTMTFALATRYMLDVFDFARHEEIEHSRKALNYILVQGMIPPLLDRVFDKAWAQHFGPTPIAERTPGRTPAQCRMHIPGPSPLRLSAATPEPSDVPTPE